MTNPQLIPDQVKGVEIIQRSFATSPHKGFLLADTMGLGKSAQAIEVAKRAEGTVIFICPTYLTFNWLDELNMWGIDQNDICVIDSGKQIVEKKKYYLIAYSRVVNKFLFDQLLKKNTALVILDESHYVKAWNSQRSNKILGTYKNKKSNLLAQTKNILLLTGTPLLTRIDDLYNVIIRVAPGVLNYMSKMEFYQNYAERLEYSAWGIKAHGVKNEEDLKRRLTPIMLRRTVIDGLSDRVDRTIKLDPNTSELKKLFAEEEKFLAEHGIKSDNVEALTKLSKVETNKIAEVRQKVALCKIPVLLDLLGDVFDNTDNPIVIYCYHRAVLSALNNALSEKFNGREKESIDGSTDLKKRHEIVKAFQAGSIDVLTATIGALREGVTLTKGSTVIFIEMSYTPSDVEQAVGRLHRKGQKNVVEVIKLIFDAGIEKRIAKILSDKTKMIDKIMG